MWHLAEKQPIITTTTAAAATTTTTTVLRPLDCVQDYPGEPVPERSNQEGKTNLDLMEQETGSGSGISWANANLHLPPRQINMQHLTTQVFY